MVMEELYWNDIRQVKIKVCLTFQGFFFATLATPAFHLKESKVEKTLFATLATLAFHLKESKVEKTLFHYLVS